MKYYKKTIVPLIESHYENLSAVEKNIADFFISNREKMDFSSKNISSMLFVSEASLSRFAKKCGYKGYREFVFHYRESFEEENQNITGQMRMVFDAYQELLNKSYNLVDENQLRRVVEMMSQKNRVFVYGRGSSGLAAQEMKIRFMRLGLDMDAIDDSDVMRMNAAVINEQCLVIGISISGKKEEVIE
ncbi:MAG: MurR/RpiR family transcriptional regulator, partial [Clostridia bacterium]|nr:MurR/RpiR family transcriptional regulator [Clostridia bacterium]